MSRAVTGPLFAILRDLAVRSERARQGETDWDKGHRQGLVDAMYAVAYRLENDPAVHADAAILVANAVEAARINMETL